MIIKLTVKEILDKNLWEEFCRVKGINEWSMNEGIMSEYDVFEFTEEEAIQLGLIQL